MPSDILGSLDRKRKSLSERTLRAVDQVILYKVVCPRQGRKSSSSLSPGLSYACWRSAWHQVWLLCLQLALATWDWRGPWGLVQGSPDADQEHPVLLLSNGSLLTKDAILQLEFWLGTLEATIIALSWIEVPSGPLDPEEQEKVNPVTSKWNRNRSCECHWPIARSLQVDTELGD